MSTSSKPEAEQSVEIPQEIPTPPPQEKGKPVSQKTSNPFIY